MQQKPPERLLRGTAPPHETPGDEECTATVLFDTLWRTLVDLIGPTATAALLQRGIKRAAQARPDLRDLVISRDGFRYSYTLPPSWSQQGDEALTSLRHLLRELWPLLIELTGPVVVRRLREVSTLSKCGVIPEGTTL